MKPFIITVDTEGDNLWRWKQGEKVYTENSLFLERFQILCNKYGFKPVYLTNYEMISDKRYVNFINKYLPKKSCEIGMHLHAWSTPPDFNLENIVYPCNAPYLVEYPFDIMEEKIKKMTEAIYNATGVKPISHRAGRWATNKQYFEILNKFEYRIDCSVTPHISWKTSMGQSVNSYGSDYSSFQEDFYCLEKRKNDYLYEVPMTIRKFKGFLLPDKINIKGMARSVKNFMFGEMLWLRPNGKNLNKMLYLSDLIAKSNDDYLMFMIHSSELMPGGSPTFLTKESIEKLYYHLEVLFKHISENFYGCTLEEFYSNLTEKSEVVDR